MSSRTAFERYAFAMGRVTAKCIDAAADSIIDGTEPDRIVDTAASVLLHGFREIESTLKTLSLIEAMIGVAAPRSRAVPKHEYLKFLIGAYLQEVYILEQRLTAYATKIQRAYRFDATTILKSIEETFSGIVRFRGEHVHSKRYADDRIDILQGIAFVESVIEGLHVTAELEYKNVRNEWLKFVKGSNAATRAFLQDYFEYLLTRIAKDGVLILPRTGKGQHGCAIPLDAEPLVAGDLAHKAAQGP